MKEKLCLFAGTTEGRELAEICRENYDLTVCVATEYGEILLEKVEGITVHTGRMDVYEMESFFRAEGFERIVDATHPFAVEVTENIRTAAQNTRIPLLRVLRDSEKFAENAVYVSSVEEAKNYLRDKKGNVFLTTGSKELTGYTGLDMGRVWARVLPAVSSIEACLAAGITPAHIIAAQGPFSVEMNTAMFQMAEASFLVTKESGRNGGFSEKIRAAEEIGAECIVIGQPPQNEGVSFEEAVEILGSGAAYTRYTIEKMSSETFDSKKVDSEKRDLKNLDSKNMIETILQKKGKKSDEGEQREKIQIAVIGIGPGSEECMTGEAKEALYASDTLIGASSVVDSVTEQIGEKGKFVKKYKEFLPDKVAEVLKNDPDIKRAAIVMRGDVGFYSGAKKVINALEQMQQYDITLIPGISSVVCFAARLGVSWEDARLISLHGKHGNLIQAVLTSKKTFVLTGGENSVGSLCGKLCEYGLGDLEVAVGECLSYPEERIIRKKAVELSGDFDTLSILYIENPAAVQKLRVGLPDEMFIRRDVPMTKSEIRAVSLSKLALQSDSVIYDIGAGTGSVSVECALNAPEGCVFAVEKNASAVDLVRENKVKFGLEKLIVIPGTAPEALEDLPVPTHAFIGGSSGNLKEIITSILEKNEKTRIVVNAVTLETLSEAVSCRKIFNFEIFDVVTLNVSCSQKLGNYNMMKAHNPVSVITMQKRKDDGK